MTLGKMLKGIYAYESQNVPNPVSEGVLLKELLCEVLKIALGEGNACGDHNFGTFANMKVRYSIFYECPQEGTYLQEKFLRYHQVGQAFHRPLHGHGDTFQRQRHRRHHH